MNDKLLSALSLCRKAGRLKMGGDVVREEIMKGGARLVLRDASPSVERAREIAEELNIVLIDQ